MAETGLFRRKVQADPTEEVEIPILWAYSNIFISFIRLFKKLPRWLDQNSKPKTDINQPDVNGHRGKPLQHLLSLPVLTIIYLIPGKHLPGPSKVTISNDHPQTLNFLLPNVMQLSWGKKSNSVRKLTCIISMLNHLNLYFLKKPCILIL